jgi:gliding motility-associated-like protein
MWRRKRVRKISAFYYLIVEIMIKQHYRLFFRLVMLIIALCCFQLTAQNKPQPVPSPKTAYSEEFIHHARALYDWNAIEVELANRLHISQADCNDFFRYVYKKKLTNMYGYLSKVKDGSITKSNATQYWIDQLPVFEKLYAQQKNNYSRTPLLQDTPPPVPTATCNNLDFTSGTTGWTAKWNNQNNTNHYNTSPLSLPANGFNSSGGTNAAAYVHELVTAGNDPYISTITRVPPGHTSAIRLGDDEAINLTSGIYPYNHQMIRNTFTVSAANPTITYWYAIVFSQATLIPHDQSDQPYFKIRLFDKNGNEIKCASYDVDATKGTSDGFKIQNLNASVDLVYKDWVNIYIPLINYIGQQVTIQFESSDCNQGGHIGYAYVAVDCAPFEAITTSPYICGSNTVQLTAPGGSNSYLWKGPGVVPPANTQTITANAPGKYTVTMTVKGNGGVICSFDLDTVIAGNANLPVALYSNTTVCVGKPTTFTDASTPVGSITEWSWDFDNNGTVDSKAQNPTHTFPTAGTFDVKLTIKQGPCDATITKKVTVEPLPVLKITDPAPLCLPNKVDITQALVTAGSTGGGILTYWTDAAATTPLTDPSAVGIAGTYYIKVTTAAGCTDIKPVVVSLNPGAVLNITNPPAICSPGTVDITQPAVTAGSTGGGVLTYWTDANTTSPLSNPTAVATSGTYYIKSTPSTGCADVQPVKVIINPLPTLVIANPAGVCSPHTVDLTAAAVTAGSTTGGTLSYWKDANASIPLTNPDAVNASGTYYIKIVIAGGCSAIQPVTVVINPLPVSNAGPDVLICTGDVGTLGTNPTANYAYSWSPQTGLSSGMVANPTVTLTNTGKVPVSTTYIVTTTNTLTGCITTDTVKVTVNSVPTVNAGSVKSVCPGVPVQLEGSIGGSATSAMWSGGAGTFADKNNVVTIYTPTPAEFAAGTVTLTLTTNDPDGPCTFASSDVILTFYKNPTVNYVVDKKEGCPVHCVTFSDSSYVPGAVDIIDKWSWNFGDPASGSNTSTLPNPKHCYANTGYYDVVLTVTSNHGCVSTLANPKMIHVFAIPIAEFYPTPNPASMLDTKVTLTNGSSPDVVYWNYHFGDGDSISPNTASPVHVYPDKASTTYLATLDVRNADGCVNTISHLIEIGPEFTFYIPNAFTPDGDGSNDFFFGKGIGIVKYDMIIFDRWGNLIFHCEKLEDQWNGKANNGDEIAQQDVYIWKVKLTDVFGKKHNYMGTVTLVK